MSEPVYFLVERVHGRNCSALVYDQLPRKYQINDVAKKRAARWVYDKRVDNQPHLAGRTRQELHDIWQALGKLPDAAEIIPAVDAGWWK
jgi:hypothetical protein